MYAILLSVALLGQIDVPAPPAPNYVPGGSVLTPPPSSGNLAEELKVYILTRLTIDLNFDEQKIAEVEKKLNTMDERQLRVLANVYYERAQARQEWEKQQQTLVLNQEQLNLQRAQAYRDHLQREYQRRIVQQQMEANLVQQGIVWQQQQMYGGYGYGYPSRYGYGGYGYGYRPTMDMMAKGYYGYPLRFNYPFNYHHHR